MTKLYKTNSYTYFYIVIHSYSIYIYIDYGFWDALCADKQICTTKLYSRCVTVVEISKPCHLQPPLSKFGGSWMCIPLCFCGL